MAKTVDASMADVELTEYGVIDLADDAAAKSPWSGIKGADSSAADDDAALAALAAGGSSSSGGHASGGGGDGDGEGDNHREKANAWTNTAMLLIADIVGTGVLSLPYAFSRLGWAGGITVLLLCYPINVYTGVLLSRMRTAFPADCSTYGTLGHRLFGKWGGLVGYIMLYSYLSLILGDYMIVMAKSIQGISSFSADLCRPMAGIVAMFILLVSNQLRTLHAISLLSVISGLTIVVALGLCVWAISMSPPESAAGNRTTEFIRREATFWDLFTSVSSFVFAMSGQKIYLEMMAEMREPADFPKALFTATPVMFVIYAFITCFTYYHLGNNTPPYLLDILGDPALTGSAGGEGVGGRASPWAPGTVITAHVLMLIHMIISYTLNSQVLCRAIHAFIGRGHVDVLDRKSPLFCRAQLTWTGITTGVLIMAFIASNAIPFFADFVSLMGSLESAPLSFLIPSIFYIRTCEKIGRRIHPVERAVLYTICGIAVILMTMGTISTVAAIAEDAAVPMQAGSDGTIAHVVVNPLWTDTRMPQNSTTKYLLISELTPPPLKTTLSHRGGIQQAAGDVGIELRDVLAPSPLPATLHRSDSSALTAGHRVVSLDPERAIDEIVGPGSASSSGRGGNAGAGSSVPTAARSTAGAAPASSPAYALRARRERSGSSFTSVITAPLVHSRAWCTTQGLAGPFVIVCYSIIILNLVITILLHCTTLLDVVQGRPGTREMLLVTWEVSLVVAVVCGVLLAKAVWNLSAATCRHSATNVSAGKRFQRRNKWRICRLYNLYRMYKSPGGVYFDTWEFFREVTEVVLQMVAVAGYAESGVDRLFLDLYVLVILVNTCSAIVMVLPRCGFLCGGDPGRRRSITGQGRNNDETSYGESKLSESKIPNSSPRRRAQRERIVLTLDVVCDGAYSIFPTIYLLATLLTHVSEDMPQICKDMRLEALDCKDAHALSQLPTIVELMFGGATTADCALKIATRLVPLWWATNRALEIVKALAVAKDLERRRTHVIGIDPNHMDKETEEEGNGEGGRAEAKTVAKEEELEKKEKGKEKGLDEKPPTRTPTSISPGADLVIPTGAANRQKKRHGLKPRLTMVSRLQASGRVARDHQEATAVPSWMVGIYISVTWLFCAFAWIRIAQLGAPCATKLPWKDHCHAPAFPLFDMALPGAESICSCNTFMAIGPPRKKTHGTIATNAATTATKTGKGVGASGDDEDCSSPVFMAKVQRWMLSKGAPTAKYAQNLQFFAGCAVNNTHIYQMLSTSQLPNLRVAAVLDPTATTSPLLLPEWTPSSRMLAMRLVRAGVSILPTSIGHLRDLSILHIEGNPRFTSIPSEIGNCATLSMVYLKDNGLQSLPSSLGRLTRIVTLAVQMNNITALPAEIGGLSNLQQLWLYRNRLRNIPFDLERRLTSLIGLSVSQNMLTRLPFIDAPPLSLRFVDVEANRIRALPDAWKIRKKVNASQLQHTYAAASGASMGDVYDLYARSQGSSRGFDGVVSLILMAGNPVVASTAATQTVGGIHIGGGGSLLEINPSRGLSEGAPLLLVSTLAECAPGCVSSSWAPSTTRRVIGNGWCDPNCNMSVCSFDGGDCEGLGNI